VQGLGFTPALLVAGLVYVAVTLTPVLGQRRWRQLDIRAAVTDREEIPSARTDPAEQHEPA
jgi:hypothetical protein